MKKTHGLFAMALALCFAAGCARANHAPPPPAAAAAAAPSSEAAALTETASAPMATSRALIMTSELRVTTKDVRAAAATIRSEVEKAGGYVSDASESGIGDERTAFVEARVPTAKTRAVRMALSDLGEITSEVEKVEDVTDARVDLGARLANARAEEKRIVDIMSQRAGSISQVLEAERELSRVRETIERLEAQERSMDGRIALATMKFHLGAPGAAPQAQIEPWRTPATSIGGAFTAGLRGAAALAVYAAMAFAAASPILLPAGLMLAFVLTVLRNQRKKRAAVPSLG